MKFLDDNLIVSGWVHVDINGGAKTSDVVSLKNYNHVAIVLDWRSPISIAIGRRGFLEENLSGSAKAEARAGAVVE